MNIVISKSTAQALKKAIYITLLASFKYDSKEINEETLALFGITREQVYKLVDLHENIQKRLSKNNTKKAKKNGIN